MRTLFSILIVLGMIGSCASHEKEIEPLRYLALGDSYTIGESVDTSLRYPVQIADSLVQYGITVKDPEIIAVTGWTTGELIRGIEREDPEGVYDLVSLLIGVNNQYRGMDIEIYREEFLELLKGAVAFSGNRPGRVIVLSIPDWGVTPFAKGRGSKQIAKEIDEYNEINRELTEAEGGVWVDVTGISRRAAYESSLVAADGLHPSGQMYTEWVKAALPVILNMVNE